MKKVILTITGPSGSGKSTLEEELCRNKKFEKVISHTSRNIRSKEINGKDYHFMDRDFFFNSKKDFLEMVEFADNFYGVHKDSLNDLNINVVVVEPEGYRQLSHYCEKKEIEHISIGLTISKQLQKKRMLSRGDTLQNVINRINKENISSEMNNIKFDININTDSISIENMKYIIYGFLFDKGVL